MKIRLHQNQWLSLKRHLFDCLGAMLFVLLLSVGGSIAKADTKPQHILWDKAPIQLNLPVGKERWVHFPESVEVINQDTKLTYDKLTLTNDAGTVYFKAHNAFEPSRLLVHLLHSGTVILFDVSANQTADDTPIQVLVPTLSDMENVTNEHPIESTDITKARVSPIELIRYAIGEIYPTISHAKQPHDIHRIPLRVPKHIVLFYQSNTTATPIASWRCENWYVTAVLIQNTLKKKVTLDPRKVHGDWVAMSLFPRNRLYPIKNPKAITTAIVLSHKPFHEALEAIPLFAHKQLTKDS